MKSLEKITNKDFINNFFKKRKKYIKKINAKIYLDSFVLDYPTTRTDGIGIYYFDLNEIYNRAEFLKLKFLPVLKDLFIEDKGDYISVLNKQYINQRLKIKSIRCKKISEQNSESKEYFINYFLNYGETKIVKPSSEDLNDQLFCTSIKFADQLNDEIYEKDIELSFKSKKTTINETDFLKYFYKKDKDLFLRDNVTIIDKNLYIPPSYRLVLTKGQK